MTNKPTILVVDRSVPFRVAIREMIYAKFPNIHLLDSDNAREALDLVERQHPHLVLLDIQLDGKSGLKLTQEIHTVAPDTTIAVFTDDDLPEYREVARRHGAEYFFSKTAPSGRKILEMIESHFA